MIYKVDYSSSLSPNSVLVWPLRMVWWANLSIVFEKIQSISMSNCIFISFYFQMMCAGVDKRVDIKLIKKTGKGRVARTIWAVFQRAGVTLSDLIFIFYDPWKDPTSVLNDLAWDAVRLDFPHRDRAIILDKIFLYLDQDIYIRLLKRTVYRRFTFGLLIQVASEIQSYPGTRIETEHDNKLNVTDLTRLKYVLVKYQDQSCYQSNQWT